MKFISPSLLWRLVLILFFIFTPASLHADDLTLHIYPSPHGVNWNSPMGLGWSTLLNHYFPSRHHTQHLVGHVTVGLRCSQSDGSTREVLTGMTSEGDADDDKSLLLNGKLGLGILFHIYQGRLQSADEIRDDIRDRLRSGDVSWIKFKINPQTCQRLLQYYDEYVELGVDHRYGLSPRPRYAEGAGCSAFGVSFLELAGILENDFRASWSESVLTPLQLIGGPTNEGRKVNFYSILFGAHRAYRWAKPREANRRLEYWDPDHIYSWIHRNWIRESRKPSGRFLATQRRGRAVGLVVDRRGVATPSEAIWFE
jgi:hypothetical protein